MLNKNELVTVRDYKPEDKNFIMSTWLKGLRYGNDWFEAIDSKIYFEFYNKVLEVILSRPDTVVRVSCLIEDPEVILGYSVYSPTLIHWVFVKRAWRSIGLAKSLVPEDIKTVSHLTTVGKSIIRKRPGMTFNPFALN